MAKSSDVLFSPIFILLIKFFSADFSKIIFIDEKNIEIKLAEKFIGERGRINCSLRHASGFWRWLGIQFVIAEK